MRRTNVYEEQSLGVYAHEDEENASFVGMYGVFFTYASDTYAETTGI